MYIPINYLIW